MLIHIGDNKSILKENLLIILDKKTVDKSIDAKRFIEQLIGQGALVNKLNENIKSYIITVEKDNKTSFKHKLYLSNISSTSLVKRKNCFNDWR